MKNVLPLCAFGKFLIIRNSFSLYIDMVNEIYVRQCRVDEVIKPELIPVVFRYRFLRTMETSEINVLQLICEAIKKVKGTVYPENKLCFRGVTVYIYFDTDRRVQPKQQLCYT